MFKKIKEFFRCKHNDKMPISVTVKTINSIEMNEIKWFCLDCGEEWVTNEIKKEF